MEDQGLPFQPSTMHGAKWLCFQHSQWIGIQCAFSAAQSAVNEAHMRPFFPIMISSNSNTDYGKNYAHKLKEVNVVIVHVL